MADKKTPQIRFKGFSDDWEQRKLIDLLDQPITDGPHETPNIVVDGVPFISADAIVNNKIDFSRKRGNITEEYDLECCKKYKPELHDVYLVKSGSTVGKVAIVETTERFNIWSPLAAMRCKATSNPYFLFFLLQTKNVQDQVKDKASNGTQPNLSMRALEQFDIVAPEKREEQIAIGCFFQELENTITLHQRELEKLKIFKKSMLENCFPKNGEKVPKVRFAGFTGDWEQCKLSDMVDVCSGMDYKHLSEGDIPVYGTGGYMLSVDVALSYDKDAIGIGRKGTIDKPYILKAPFWTVDTLFYCIPKCLESIDFVYDLFQRVDWKKKDESTGVPSLSKVAINDTDVMVPSELEQQKIGTYFKNLDHLITLHQSKLDKLQIIKKSMLEKMFV